MFSFQHISKSFGSVSVLRDINLELHPGQVHAICGENGAGKSTLMKIMSGVYQPTAGEMCLEGQPYCPSCPLDAIRAGIAMIYQELDLAEHLTVTENIFLGRELTVPGQPWRLDAKAMRSAVQQLLKQYDFHLNPDTPVADLSIGESQLVELLKALHRQARIIVMDEPTSALSEKEAEQLFRIIGELRKRGLAIVYISHRMEEIQRLADVVTVLRDGRLVETAPLAEMSPERIIRLMVGRELTDYYPERKANIGPVAVSVTGLNDHRKISDISFEIHAGEIVGMAGLVGAGRTEVANAIFGVTPGVSGQIALRGTPLSIHSPADAIRAGIAYLTEDRKRTGLCVNLPCAWNITLPNFQHIGMNHLLDLHRERLLAEKFSAEMHTKWNSPDEPASNLSGGNQQKLLLARWLMAESEFLIFDEPTRGIDVGAKKEVYTLLNSLAESGKAILLISSELPEILGVCDRILVMRDGRLAANLPRNQATQEIILRHAAG